MTAIDVDAIADPTALTPKPEPARDRYGRYMLPDATGRKIKAYTRATTVAKTLADTYNLEQWKMRMVAHGLAGRPDLIGLASAHNPDTDRKVFEEVVDAAMEAAESASGRRDGTTLHRFTELVDIGARTIDQIPQPYRARVEAYQATLAEAGVQIHPEWSEQIFMLDLDPTNGADTDTGPKASRFEIAGTADRIVTLADGRRVIADLKTGKDVKFGELEFAIQLAIYANHSATYNQAKQRRGKRIDVDTEVGLIIHLPSKGEGCHLHLVDLKVGYDALLTAMEVREWRKTKTLRPYKPLSGGTGGAGAVRDWLIERIRIVASTGEWALADLGARWPSTVPQPLPAELAQYQIEDLAVCLDRVEAAHQIPLGATRPGLETPTNNRRNGQTT